MPEKLHQKKYISRDWDSFDLIITDFLKQIPKNILPPSYGCLGVAGRVSNNACKITNLSWELNSQRICTLTGLKWIELINDFSILIYGIKYLQKHQYEVIQGVERNNNPPKTGLVAILGAGTGLGMARGLITSTGVQILPSEGGHREFSPRSQKEWDLLNWLKKDLGIKRLSLEKIVSGSGLGHISRWLLLKPDAKFHPLRKIAENFDNQYSTQIDMASIASQSAKDGDELMSEAVEIWLNAYGSAAGDVALQELCYGGLWIGGGTTEKHIKGIKSISFLGSLREKGRFKTFLEKLPVMALTDPEVGLFSAGCRACLLPNEMGDLD